MSAKITRRQAITRTSLAVGGALLGNLDPTPALAAPKAATATTAAGRPNILLLIAEGWSWQGAEAVDRLGLRMPMLAQLRRVGMSFENAFIASPQAYAAFPKLLETSGYAIGHRNPGAAADSEFEAFLARRPAGKPFFFRLGASGTRRQANGIDPGTIAVPPYLPDTPSVRRDIADYRCALEQFDHEAGLLIDRLRRDGELANTLIIMTGDGGWSFPRGAGTLYDAGTHIPLVVLYPRSSARGRVSKAMISSADVGATLLDVAGVAQPAMSTAQSLVPLMMQNGDGNRTFVLTSSESAADGGGAPRPSAYPCRAIRTQRYLYIRNVFPEHWPAGAPARQAVTPERLARDIDAAFAGLATGPAKTAMIVGRGDPAIDRMLELATGKRPAVELYDVQADPYQLTNLAGDPAMATIVSRLDQQLLKHAGQIPPKT